jgi:hypothetical protein
MALTSEDLQQLVGARARLWDFMPSHDHTVIKLLDERSKARFLVLSGCNEITAPVSWVVQSPQFVRMPDRFFEFCDNSVRIICQDASLHDTYSRPR